MCDICHRTICPSACPNAPDPVVGVCARCRDYIYQSEARIQVAGGDCYHRDCLEGLSIEALLAELGIDCETRF